MLIEFLAAASILTPASGSEGLPKFPKTPDENYAVGEQFAACSAYFLYFASLAEQAEKPDSKAWAESVARGWEAAGVLFLIEGLEPAAQENGVAIFESLVELKLTDYKHRVEVREAEGVAELRQEYDHDCLPYVPMQEAMIEVLRRNNFGLAE